MKPNPQTYPRYALRRAKKSPLLPDCLHAFWVGGLICAIGQCLKSLFSSVLRLSPDESSLWVSVSLVGLAALLTGIGVFDKIARYAGAGTLVPITGFANAVVAPAIDTKAEGYILGVGAKIFTVAGPVLLYGTITGFAFGIIYFVVRQIGGGL